MLAAVIIFPSNNGVSDAKTITEADIKALKEKISNNKNNIKKYSTNASSFDGDINEALEAKELLDQQITATADLIDQTEELISYYEKLIDDKHLAIVSKEQEINDKTRIFGLYLRSSYENGKISYLEMLLSADSIVDFLTRADNLGSMMNYQKSLVTGLDDELSSLHELKDDLEIQKQECEETRLLQKQTKKELESQLKTQEKLLKKLESDKAAAAAALKKAESNEDALQKELNALIKKYQKQEEEKAKQALQWPLSPTYNKISSPYGNRVLYGVSGFHRGIDIPAPNGTPILAANDGTVILAKYSSSYGNYIIVDHGGKKSTLYAHCSQILVKVGDKVKRGQTIGKVGATGNAYGYHLHFEVRIDGQYTNPMVKGMLTISYKGKMVDPVTTSGAVRGDW